MQLISPLLPDFLARYPQLRLELDINNHPVSLISERIDVAIRITDNPEPGLSPAALAYAVRCSALRRAGCSRTALCNARRSRPPQLSALQPFCQPDVAV
jgi:DNA-binding transcriptional LysR family regulator